MSGYDGGVGACSIQRSGSDPVRTVLIRSLVDFARGLGARVVAEGVETAEEAAVLRDLAVGYGQGWYFGRPAVPESVRAPEPEPARVAVIPVPRPHRVLARRI